MAYEVCPVCGSTVPTYSIPQRGVTVFQCSICGHFEWCEEDALQDLEPKFLLSSFLRKRYERTGTCYTVSDREDHRNFPQNIRQLPVVEKLNEALLWAADKSTSFGVPSSCRYANDWPIAQSKDAQEFASMLKYWCSEGALGGDPRETLIVTGKGWRTVEEIRPAHGQSGKQAFVAMSFSPEMDSAYDHGIEPALRECGWNPVRVDREPPSEGKICDRIIAQIRGSSLAVIECTGRSPNVYFEAGFAMGLAIPIIWCVQKKELDENAIAFDTRQYPHLPWEKVEELRSMLVDRIRALYTPR